MKIKVTQVVKEKPKSAASYELLAKNLRFYSLQRLEITKKEEAAKKELAEYIDKNMKADEKGHRFMRFMYEDKPMMVIRQARKSVSVSIEKMKEYFASDILSRVIKETMIESIDEQALEELVQEEVISMEELEAVTEVKTTYATVISEEKKDDESEA